MKSSTNDTKTFFEAIINPNIKFPKPLEGIYDWTM
jgi:hypothetical protein